MVSGNIIAATAVLLIHIDKKVVTPNKYATESFKLPLASRTM